jgi:hypothetical protein
MEIRVALPNRVQSVWTLTYKNEAKNIPNSYLHYSDTIR